MPFEDPAPSWDELIMTDINDAKRRIADELSDIFDPRTRFYLDPKTLTDNATYEDLWYHLWLARVNHEWHEDYTGPGGFQSDWILFAQPIAYKNSQERANWSMVKSLKPFQCFNKFFAEKIDHQTCHMGLFVTKNQKFAIDKKWEEEPWHAWWAALCRDLGSK